MTEQTLTRNQSAKLFSDKVGDIITLAPVSTGRIREFGLDIEIGTVRVLGMHDDHYGYLAERLSSKPKTLPDGRVVVPLDEIDKFAAMMRAVGGEAKVPWYDAPGE